jgi:hypothetical protein
MNVEFTWDTEFDATIVLDSEILPNKYHIILGMVTNTSDQSDQVQAFEKVKFFLKDWMQHSCFSEHGTPSFNILMEHFDQKIVQLPVSASDLIIGAALFSKLYAIVDGYLIFDFVHSKNFMMQIHSVSQYFVSFHCRRGRQNSKSCLCKYFCL